MEPHDQEVQRDDRDNLNRQGVAGGTELNYRGGSLEFLALKKSAPHPPNQLGL